METKRRPMFSIVCKTTKNHISAFSSPLSTPLMVRKGRGSQKEETKWSNLSLIVLVPNLGEKTTPWIATNNMWSKAATHKAAQAKMIIKIELDKLIRKDASSGNYDDDAISPERKSQWFRVCMRVRG